MAITDHELDRIDAYWRAANYLSVGQIYLLDNPLLKEPLRPEHVKPRLLGHWGTTPGLNMIYAHMNRVIRNWDLEPRGAGDAGLHPRGRRARLRALARVRGRLRQPGPAGLRGGRRRGGRD